MSTSTVAFLAFFGLGGLVADMTFNLAPGWQVGTAIATGLMAFYIVGFIMMSLGRLESQGNVDLTRAVGGKAQVYLVIPAERTGTGKITITLKEQSLQINAVTAGAEIRTGQQVEVVGMSDPETYEVVPV